MNEPPTADRLLGPEPPELGCDECFEFLDRYVDAELGHEVALCAACVSPAECTRRRHCVVICWRSCWPRSWQQRRCRRRTVRKRRRTQPFAVTKLTGMQGEKQ